MIHAVLYQPEIPQNTGNIIRTCAAFNVELDLIEPLGFYLDEPHLRRAGMDYRDLLDVHRFPDWQTFTDSHPGTYYYTTRYGSHQPDEFDYRSGDELYFVFGRESTGIPKEILKRDTDHCIRIPMDEKARCLNLSNTVAIVLYEAMRQRKFAGLAIEEVMKQGIL